MTKSLENEYFPFLSEIGQLWTPCGNRSPTHDDEDNAGDYEKEVYDDDYDDDDNDYQGRFACHTSARVRTRKCQRSQARLLSTSNVKMGRVVRMVVGRWGVGVERVEMKR